MFSHLYSWLAQGEMTGRFVFDLGQSLYEAGRPKIGHMMMQRGFETTDAAAEGRTLSIHPINTHYQYTLSMHPVLQLH